MDTIALLFVNQPGSLAGGIIQMIDGGVSSHVGIQRPDGGVVDTTFRHRGVAVWSLQDWMHGRVLADRVEVPVPRISDGMAWLNAQVGKPYDWTALAGWLLWLNWQQDDRWFCSELAAGACTVAGRRISGPFRRIGVDTLHKLAHAWADAPAS